MAPRGAGRAREPREEGPRQEGSPQERAPRQPLKSYDRILEEEFQLADSEMDRPAGAIVASGILAGLGVGISVLIIAVFSTLAPDAGGTLGYRLLVGNAYAAGFLIVIFSRADLFTEYTTIALVPVMLGRSPLRSLARLWGLVYASNLVGALVVAAFLVWFGRSHGGIAPGALGAAAEELTRHSATTIVLSGLLAGWLMGFMSWLVVAARETISQVVFVWVIGVTIGLAALHHSITGAAEVSAALFAGEAEGIGTFLKFLLPATLGNALGAVIFAGLVRYSVARR